MNNLVVGDNSPAVLTVLNSEIENLKARVAALEAFAKITPDAPAVKPLDDAKAEFAAKQEAEEVAHVAPAPAVIEEPLEP